MFYFLIVIFYYLFFLKEQRTKKLSIFICFYLATISIIGINTYVRSGVFYLTPLDQREALSRYFEPYVLSKSQKISETEAKNKIELKNSNWIEENRIDLDLEVNILQYYDFKKKESLKVILSELPISIKRTLVKTLHSGLLDPVHVYFYHTTEYEGTNPYYKSKLHKEILNYRLIYSVLIYFLSCLGFIYLYKFIPKKILFILFISYLYFLFILGWMGSTRYYAASLPYLLIFVSSGVFFIKNKMFSKKIIF